MKKGFQWMALLVVAMLGACSGGSDKAAAEKVDEKPRVKLAEVSSRPVEQIQEYTATVEAEVKNNIAPLFQRINSTSCRNRSFEHNQSNFFLG